MLRKTWLRNGLCLLAAMAMLLCGALALAEEQGLTAPEFTMASSVVRGEFLAVTIDNAAANEGFENLLYNAAVYYEPDDVLYPGWYGWDGEAIMVPTSNLEADRTYQLWVDASADGVDFARTIAEFSVTEPEAGSVALRFSKTDVVPQEGFLISVYAPGATAIRTYHNGDENARWDGDCVLDTWSHDRNEVFEITVSACYGDPDNEDDWTEPSGGVTITVASTNGTMPEPQISAASSVARGEFLEVTVDNAEAYIGPDAAFDGFGLSAVIYCPDDDEWFESESSFWDGANAIMLPTVQLSPDKTYELHAYAWAYDWSVSEAQQPLAITEPESGDEHPIYLSIDKTDVLTHENYTFSVYAPGATAIRSYYKYTDDENGEWCEDLYWDGDMGLDAWFNDYPMELDYAVRACYGDPNNEEDWGEMSDTVHVSVTAPNGSMGDVFATLEPVVLNAGDDLTVTVEALEHATEYWMDVHDHDIHEGDDCVFFSDIGMDGSFGAVTVPGDVFLAGHTYTVWVHARGEAGYRTSDNDYYVVVRPEREDGEEEAVIVWINGVLPPQDRDAMVNENVNIEVLAPENATGLLFFEDGSVEPLVGNYYETTRNYDWGGQHFFMAKYTTQEFDEEDGGWWNNVTWDGCSDVRMLSVYSWGDLDWFGGENDEVRPIRGTMPSDAYTRGEFIEVTIENLDDYFDKACDLGFMTITAQPYDPENDRWFEGATLVGRVLGDRNDPSVPRVWEGGTVIMVPTADLEPDVGYEMHLRAEVYGHNDSTALATIGNGDDTVFTVTEPEYEDRPIYMSLSSDSVLVNEEFVLSVYAPGAEAIQVCWTDNGWDWHEDEWDYRDGDNAVFTWRDDRPKEYDYGVKALYDGEWSDMCEPIHLSVYAQEMLGISANVGPVVLRRDAEGNGEGLTISFDYSEHATWYWIDVNDCDAEGEPNIYNVGHSYPFSLTLPLDMFEEGHFYKLWVHVQGEKGYESNDLEYGIVRAYDAQNEDAAPQNVVLTVNGMSDDVSWPLNKNFNIYAAAPADATGVFVMAGNLMEGFEGRFVSVEWWHGDQPGPMPIVARYTTQDLEELSAWGGNWWDSPDIEWAGYSNTLTLYIYANGYNGSCMPMPAVTVNDSEEDEITVGRGELLTVSVDNIDDYINEEAAYNFGDVNVRATFYDESTDFWYRWYDWDGSVIMLPTADIQMDDGETERTLRLVVTAEADGYYNGDNWDKTVTVTRDAEEPFGITLTASKDSLSTSEDYVLSMYAPGANAIRLFRNDEEDRYWVCWQDYNGDGLVDYRRENYPEEIHYYAIATWGDPDNPDDWDPENNPGVCKVSDEVVVDVWSDRAVRIQVDYDSVFYPENGDRLAINIAEIVLDGEEPVVEYADFEIRDAEVYDVDNWVYWASGLQCHYVPAEAFTPGHTYKLRVHASARGYEGFDQDFGIVAMPLREEGEESAVSLAIYTRDGGDSCYFGEDFGVVAIAPDDATGVYVSNGCDWDAREGNVYEDYGWRYDEPAHFTFIAKYTAQNLDELGENWAQTCEWAGCSDPVTVNVVALGAIPEPEISADDTVVRGEWLEIDVGNAAEYMTGAYGDFRVQACVQSDDNWWSDWTDLTVDMETMTGSIIMPTANLRAGHYNLIVKATARGWYDRETVRDLTVTEPEIGDERPIYLSFSTDTAITKVPFSVSIYAPGAAAIHLYNQYGDNWNWGSAEDPCEGVSEQWNEGHQQEWDFWAEALYIDPETGDEAWGEPVGPVHLSVIAPNGKMEPVVIDLSATVLNPGDSLDITFNPVDNATEYWFEVYDDDDHDGDSNIFSGSFDSAPRTYTVPAELLIPGHNYSIHACAAAFAYDNSDAYMGFTVLPENAGGAITLTVNGSSEDQEIPVGNTVRVEVEAPEEATGVYVINCGVHEEAVPGNSCMFENGDWYLGEARVYTYTARYTTDEIDPDSEWWFDCDWAGYADPVTVTATSYGRLPMLAFSIPATVTRGDILEITIDNADEYRGMDDGTLWLNADAWYNAEDRWYGRYDWNSETGVITMPTAEMEAGRYYELHVDVGAEGWEGNGFQKIFFVVEPETDDIRVTADRTEILTREQASIGVYAPGANALRMYRDGELCDGWDGDCVTYRVGDNEPSVHDYAVSACYGDPENEDDWSALTEPITITVTAPGGRLPMIAVDGPAVLQPGEDFTFTVVNQDGSDMITDGIDVNMWRDRDWQWMWQDYSSNPTFTIPAVADEDSGNTRFEGLDVLEAGEMYHISITVNQTGWISVDYSVEVFVDDGAAVTDQIILTLNDQEGADSVSVMVNQPFHLVVSQPEEATVTPTAIRIYNCGGPWGEYRGGTVDDWRDWGELRSGILFARYTTDELPEDDGEIDWDNLNWSEETSNIVTLTTTGYARADEPRFDAPETVVRGELVTVTVTNREEGCDYHAEFDRESDGWRTNRVDWDGSGSVQLTTANLEPGEYRILVSNHGAIGLQGRETFKRIIITEPEEPMFSVDKTDVLTRESFTISAYVPGAQEIILNYDTHGEEYWYYEGGDSFIVTRCIDDPGEHVFSARWMDENGDWYTVEHTVSVNVSAPYGWITLPDIAVSSFAPTVGQGLSVDLNPEIELDFAFGFMWNEDVNEPRWEEGHGSDEGWHYEVPADAMGEVGNYRIGFNLYALGYMPTTVEYRYVVTEETASAARITINGSAADCTFLINEPFTVRVKGPTRANAVALYDGGGWHFFHGNLMEDTFSQGDVSTRNWYARYTLDEVGADPDWWSLNWSNIGNVIRVTTTADGQLPAPEASLDKTELARGEMLTVFIDNPVEGAFYNAGVYRPADDQWFDWFDWNEETIPVETVNLESGDYELYVNCGGVLGYEGNGTVLNFTVLEPEEPTLSTNFTDVLTNERFRIMLYAPGATANRIYLNGDVWHERDGDMFNEDCDIGEVGEHTIGAAWCDENGDWHEAEQTVTVNVTAPYGPVGLHGVDFPAAITSGEDLVIQVYPMVDLTVLGIQVGNRDNGEFKWEESTEYDYDNGWQLTVPAEAISEPANYNFSLTMWAVGFETTMVTHNFVVTDGEQADVTLTINDSTEDQTFWVWEGFHVRVDAPEEATGIAVYTDGFWQYFAGSSVEFDECQGLTYVSQWYAKYTTDGFGEDPDWESLGWSGIGNVVVITTISNGPLPTPEAILDETVVNRGETLTVTIDDPFEGACYTANIYCPADDWWVDASYDWNGETISVPTLGLDAGDYELYVNADGSVGYDGSESAILDFTVVEPEEPVFYMGVAETLTHAPFSVTLYAPGAQELIVNCDTHGEDWWHHGEGDSFEGSFWCDEPGEYVFSARWMDENGDWHNVDHTETVNVTAPYGPITLPNIVFSSYAPTLGEGLSVELNPEMDLVFARLSLFNEDIGEYRWGEDRGEEDEFCFDIPAEALSDLGNYHIPIDVQAVGYEPTTLNYHVVVVPETASAARITINGSASDRTFQINEPFTVRVKGPTRANAVALYDGCVWSYHYGNLMEGESCQSEVSTRVWYARYTLDEVGEDPDWESLNWSAIGNVIAVTTWAEGQLPAPEAWLDRDEVARGETFTIYIDNPVEGAWYNAGVYRLADDQWLDWYDWDGETIPIVETVNLESGDYELHVNCGGIVGYDNNSTVLNFTVVEPDELTLTTNYTDVLTNENFRIMLYVPGATANRIYLNGDLWHEREGDIFNEDWSIGDAGEYALSAAWCDENGDWHESEQTVTMNVTAPYGPVGLESVEFDGAIVSGEDLVIQVNPSTDLHWLSIGLWNRDNGEEKWVEDIEYDDENGWRITIPADVISEPANYNFDLNMRAVGHEYTWVTHNFVVTDGEQANVTLTINDSTEDQTFWVWEGFHVRVEAPEEATGIAVYTDGFWQYFAGSSVEFDECQGLTYVSQWYAKYTTDGLGEDPDWESLGWSGIGNVVVITTISNGPMPAPNASLDETVVTCGETLTVAIDDPFEGAYYYASAYRPDDDCWFDRYDWNGETITVPTIDLDAGDYELHVGSDGTIGFDGNETVLTFTVVEPEEMVMSLSKTEVVTLENTEVFVVAPGAQRIVVTMDRNGDEGWRNGWDEETDKMHIWANSGGVGEYTFTATAYYGDGTTDVRTAELTITAQGQLEPEIVAYSALSEGEDLVFTIVEPNAEWCSVSVNDVYDGREIMREDGVGLGEFAVPADLLQRGASYNIWVYVAAENWNEGCADKIVSIFAESDLSVMNLPAFLTEIGEEAFAGSAVQRVIISDNTTAIGERAFADCASLFLVEIPESVTFIADNAFENSPCVIFVCGEGSTAAQFAADHGIPTR